MTIVSNLELIRRVPLFADLPIEQARLIADAVNKRRYKRGELLIEQGTQSHALFVILAGRAKVLSSNGQGREVILARLGAGDYMGEMSLIDGQAHSATVQAETQMDALILGRAEFMHCQQMSSALCQAIMCGLVQRLRHADRKIETLALLDVYGRVARALVEMAQPQEDGSLQIDEKISRQELAKVVGASREMVSRVMKEFFDAGYLVMQGDQSVIIQDRLLNQNDW